MNVTYLGKSKAFPDGLTVSDWLVLENITNTEVALIQVNGVDVVPDERPSVVLKDGDEITLLYFLGDS